MLYPHLFLASLKLIFGLSRFFAPDCLVVRDRCEMCLREDGLALSKRFERDVFLFGGLPRVMCIPVGSAPQRFYPKVYLWLQKGWFESVHMLHFYPIASEAIQRLVNKLL